jgi:hypothetical protein
MVIAAQYNVVAAVVVAWLLGWFSIRAWYRRGVEIGRLKLLLVQHERDIERQQKEGLRRALRELRPDASILAMEISNGDPEIRRVVQALAGGAKISIIVDPSKIPIPVDQREIKTIAVHAYISANGLSRTISGPIYATSAGTQIAIEVVCKLPIQKDESG